MEKLNGNGEDRNIKKTRDSLLPGLDMMNECNDKLDGGQLLGLFVFLFVVRLQYPRCTSVTNLICLNHNRVILYRHFTCPFVYIQWFYRFARRVREHRYSLCFKLVLFVFVSSSNRCAVSPEKSLLVVLKHVFRCKFRFCSTFCGLR